MPKEADIVFLLLTYAYLLTSQTLFFSQANMEQFLQLLEINSDFCDLYSCVVISSCLQSVFCYTNIFVL